MAGRMGGVAALLSLTLVATLHVGCGGPSPGAGSSPATVATPQASTIALPQPRVRGPVSLEEALSRRRSVRTFAAAPVSIAEIAQLLWAAQGVTDSARGLRTAPSAGALYPLEIYLVAERATDLKTGVYRYVAEDHALAVVSALGVQSRLYEAALSQAAVGVAPAVLVVAAVFERTTGKYGDRGRQYVYLEAGHAAQNVLLQAVALGLGAVVVGAFDDGAVHRVVGMGAAERPIYLIPFGKKAEG
jgi:SagB-type dehydrogenase family enzyme